MNTLIGEKVKNKRLKEHKSRNALCRELNICAYSLRQIENGHHLGPKLLKIACKYAGIRIYTGVEYNNDNK